MQLPFLLNWYLNPYHTPLVVAKQLGYFSENDIELSILEPTNPSDVTKIIGQGHVSIGLKAMVHCFAARVRGFPIKSIATLLDEPPTGLIVPNFQNIHSIKDIADKKIGYVGEFGKIMIDHLVRCADMPLDCYEAVRVGMDAAKAILSQQVDAAIGISCFQQIELEDAGIPCHLLRIDRLAHLGCCCFCSIQVIGHETFLNNNPTIISQFVNALQRGAEFTREYPHEAWEYLLMEKPSLNTPTFHKIFLHNLPFFSRDCHNVSRDWNQVAQYVKKLGISDEIIEPNTCYTNDYFNLNPTCAA